MSNTCNSKDKKTTGQGSRWLTCHGQARPERWLGYTRRKLSGCPSHSETLLLDGQGGWQRHRIPIMTPSRWKKASGYPVHLIAF